MSDDHGCSSGHCHSHSHSHHHHDKQASFAHQLLEIADEAWMEVLAEKIKAQVEQSNGSQLDQLAKLVGESNKERWKHKLALLKLDEDFKHKVDQHFNKE